MSREIRFRGQDFYTGEWRYGSYNGVNAGAADVFIIYEKEVFDTVSGGFIDVETVEKIVKEETVGQYTGLKDRQGVEIYEGDIVDCERHGFTTSIEYYGGAFRCRSEGVPLSLYIDECYADKDDNNQLEVIGNIYEGILSEYANPELLEAELWKG